MDPTQTSYLLQKVAPLVMRELGPRVGPLFAEKVGIPLAKKVGLPIARRIGIPIARKTGTLLLNKVAYPYLNKVLLKATPITQTVNPQSAKGTAVAKGKQKNRNLKDIIWPKKNKKATRANNVITPVVPAPVNQIPSQVPSQMPSQVPSQAPYQVPYRVPYQIPSPLPQSIEQNPSPYMNYNSNLFTRRKQNFGYDSELR